MSIRVALHHETRYTFARPVRIDPHVVRLRPAPHSRTRIEAYSLKVAPASHFLNWQQDPFGNYLARLVFPEPATELSFTVELVADMTVINPFDFFVEDYAQRYPFAYPDALRRDLAPYLRRVGADEDGTAAAATLSAAVTTDDDAVDAWIETHVRPTGALDGTHGIVDFLVAINRAVRDSVGYTTRLEVGVHSPGETLDRAIGSCRDSAWLLVSVLRRFGIAARFVSGYLVQLASDHVPIDGGPAGPVRDFTDLHAWTEAYIPGAGWIGLDATSGLLAGEGHIPLSATPEPETSAPITGSTEVVDVDFAFVNEVRRIFEDPRVTKPYSDEQWARIDALGAAVDERLEAGDVRLTMGGEPTFVTAGDTSDPQWESAADGAEKRTLSARLATRLAERWAPGGIVHHGQGKWYPGEDLPRWQTQIAWRTDGRPLWRRQEMLADPHDKPTLPEDPEQASARAAALTRHIAAGLGISADHVLPAYEDVVQVALGEAQQPVGERPSIDPDPASPAATTAIGRARLVEDLDAELGENPATAYVLPVFVDPDGEGWATTTWRTRRRALFLTGGTSAAGYRLPLGSLAWGEPPEPTRNHDGDTRRPLADAVSGPAAAVPQAREIPVEEAPRTALVIEPRGGHAHVFLPPLDRLDDGVALLAVIEAASAATSVPVVLEGYRLPDDDRLASLSITPDPGVIEVNVQPSATWAELRELTTSLFADARHSGLSTEKFALDGTHTGTGGGNHITLGGPTPADSPFLRRPDLLASLVTYWQWHPGLSYLFTGRFIGSTSQAPRVDEGLASTLGDLEIAFAEIRAMVDDPAIDHDVAAVVRDDWTLTETPDERIARQRFTQPWLVDRLLRHLLTDVTGNTHRSEFCIDKLYSPDSRTGRLGLVELRGFEMPPHPRMSLMQAALVRALVARFWEAPVSGPLVRWGTRLHDRFLLPAFVAADLREVIAELNAHMSAWPADATTGQPPYFDERWLEPFLEFRFPRLGEARIGEVQLELRQAIEPWQVLGEEVSLDGTARYVDSSVERVQVSAVGLTEGRHALTCNGVPIPTVPIATTGWGVGRDATSGARVGGVRFRAWDPPSAMHPTIGVHAPLDFDLVDVRNGISLGGFTYHVTHPGGRSYDTYPVNEVEAESRRTNRFEERRTSGAVDTSGWHHVHGVFGGEPSEFPVTLDLRRHSRGRHPATASGDEQAGA